MLSVHSLYFSYEGMPLLRGLSFSAERGEIVALIGISGSGKTTLFRLIAGFLQPEQGSITIEGKTGDDHFPQTTYMRQEDLLLPWRRVLENLTLFAELGKNKIDKAELLKEAKILLSRVGLAGYEKAFPHQLSGGMRQRVSLARALLQKRPLILLDEPFASLDVIIREQLYALLKEIRDHYQKTLLLVTHDFRDAIALADRILILAQGKIGGSYQVADFSNREELMRAIRSHLTNL